MQRLVESVDGFLIGIISFAVVFERNRIVGRSQAHKTEPHIDRNAGRLQAVRIGSVRTVVETADPFFGSHHLVRQIVLSLHVVGITPVRTDQISLLRLLGQHPARIEAVVLPPVNLRIAVEFQLEVRRLIDFLFGNESQIGQVAEHRHFAQINVARHSFDITGHFDAFVGHFHVGHLARVIFLKVNVDIVVQSFLACFPFGFLPVLSDLFFGISPQARRLDPHGGRFGRIRNDQQAQKIIGTFKLFELIGHIDRESAPSFGDRQADHVLLDARPVVIDRHDHELHARSAEIIETQHRHIFRQLLFQRGELNHRVVRSGRHLEHSLFDLFHHKTLRLFRRDGQRHRILGMQLRNKQQGPDQQQADKTFLTHLFVQ